MHKFFSRPDAITGSIVIKGLATVLIGIIFLSSSGCSESDDTDEWGTPLCEINDTAEVNFRNDSTTITMEVVWDGAVIATLDPGETSDDFTQNVGNHTSVFRNANTHENVCAIASPNLAQCTVHTYSCEP
jgi:hypothetical protein